MKDPAEYQQRVIVCAVKETAQWLTPGSVDGTCLNCKALLSISKDGQEFKRKFPDTKTICMVCVKHLQGKKNMDAAPVPGAIDAAAKFLKRKLNLPETEEEIKEDLRTKGEAYFDRFKKGLL